MSLINRFRHAWQQANRPGWPNPLVMMLGTIIMFFGVLGLFLPHIPGTILFIIGLFLLLNKDWHEFKRAWRENKK